MKIYQIDSSARKKGSTSRALAKKLLDKIKKPGDEVIYRDLDDEMLFVSGLTESGMVEVKTFDKADEVNDNFNNAKIEAVKVGNQRVMKLTLQPGWKWSKDIKPTVGGDSCQATHLGVIVSGAVCAKHNDGTEMTYKAGDAYAIQPGHDGWVVGNEPAVVYEFHGMWGE